MNRHVNAIAGRLSLRPPQRLSLEILDRITEIVPPRKAIDLGAALATIQSEFPGVTDFEREFPSLCFALATGVGKTRLMGAFIGYLHLAHGFNNFFVLAPNLTIYNKLIADFTPNTAKYVLKGISEFAVAPPVITTGENYERQIASGGQLFPTTINIFNISKINSEVRGGRSPRIRSFREEIGESYFDYLAGLDDLVLIMDESHRYRASAGRGQFQIYYRWGAENPEYQPDFVAETKKQIFMLEPKASNQMTDAEVLAKKDVAVRWCSQASDHARSYGGKPWVYVLIPHDAIADNMTLEGLAQRFS